MTPTPDQIRADRAATGLTQSEYAAIGRLSAAQIASVETGRKALSLTAWDLLRARSALLRGDRRAALAVLSETL